VNNTATMAYKITALLRDPERLAALKANARRLGRPRAAFDVVERSLKLVGYGGSAPAYAGGTVEV
jgi:processive 1,2-diacylglycerol beta-glucosyltransferase